jgi:hypothetical protein
MTQLKLLSAALFAAAVIASPAMAHPHAASQYSSDDTYVAPMQGSWPGTYGNHRNGVSCVSAPREGQFASEQWDNDVPCEPGTLHY